MSHKGGVARFIIIVFLVALLFPSSLVYAAAAFSSVTILQPVTSTPSQPGSPSFDRIPPVIVDVSVKRIGPRQVEIAWTTNEETESYFAFGLTNNYELGERHLPGYYLRQRVILSDLEFDKKYLFRIVVIDRAGNNASSFNYFTLLFEAPPVIPEPVLVPPPEPGVPPHKEPQTDAPGLPIPQREKTPVPGTSPGSPVPAPVHKPTITIPAPEPPVIIPSDEVTQEDTIISDANEKIIIELPSPVRVPKTTPFEQAKVEVSDLAMLLKKNISLLIPNKIFAVPDFAYGPFVMSVLLFILSLFA